MGNWLREQRLARGLTTQIKARRALAQAGIPIAESVYAEWESGTRLPSDAQIEKLTAFYGSSPFDGVEPSADLSALVAALSLQAAAIDRQARAQEESNALMREEVRLLRAEFMALREADATLLGATGEQVEGLAVETHALLSRVEALESRVHARRRGDSASGGTGKGPRSAMAQP